MSEEDQEWIFVNRVPLLCKKNRIMRQQKVETWLDLYKLKREIEASAKEQPHAYAPLDYVS